MANNITAHINKNDMKSLFYLFNGKPDSRIKLFNTPIQIEKQDIFDLNARISNKLKTHQTEASIASVRIGYTGSKIDEFGTWEGFKNHDWSSAERVEEVVVKWDFMVLIEGYEAPQRHTLLVRISQDFKKTNFIQMLAAANSDDFNEVDIELAPGFCRVDFINAQMSKELINEVSDWFSSIKSPKLISDVWYWCKKHRQIIAESIDHWFLLSWVLLQIAFLIWASQKWFDGTPPLSYLAGAIIFGVYFALIPIKRLTHLLGQKIYTTLEEIEGSRVVFDLTAGDKKAIAERIQKNQEKGNKFMFDIALKIIFNVVSNIFAYYLPHHEALPK